MNDEWAIQTGLSDADPILIGKDGVVTMRADMAKSFSSKEAAERYATGMRCPWRAINLSDLKHEQSFDEGASESESLQQKVTK